jgi:heme exporter protein CcmD
MQWNSWQEFLTMRGYGLYVWGSFGACAVAMILEPLWVRNRWNAIRTRQPRQERS